MKRAGMAQAWISAAALTGALFALPTWADEAPTKPDKEYFILDAATFDPDALQSEAARAECELPRKLPEAVLKAASGAKIKATLVNDATSLPEDAQIVSLMVGKMSAGRGSAFRIVVSDMSMSATIKRNGQAVATTQFQCSAGVRGLSGFGACDRLERCARQLGVRTARWLAQPRPISAPDAPPTQAPDEVPASPAADPADPSN